MSNSEDFLIKFSTSVPEIEQKKYLLLLMQANWIDVHIYFRQYQRYSHGGVGGKKDFYWWDGHMTLIVYTIDISNTETCWQNLFQETNKKRRKEVIHCHYNYQQ